MTKNNRTERNTMSICTHGLSDGYGSFLNFIPSLMSNIDSHYIFALSECNISNFQMVRMILIFNYFSTISTISSDTFQINGDGDKENITPFRGLNLTKFGEKWQNGIIKGSSSNDKLANNGELMALLMLKGHHHVFHFLSGKNVDLIAKRTINQIYFYKNRFQFCPHMCDTKGHFSNDATTKTSYRVLKIMKNMLEKLPICYFTELYGEFRESWFYDKFCKSCNTFDVERHYNKTVYYKMDTCHFYRTLFGNMDPQTKKLSETCFECVGINSVILATRKLIQIGLLEHFVILKKILEKEFVTDLLFPIFGKFMAGIIPIKKYLKNG